MSQPAAVNPMPPVIVALFLFIMGVEAIFAFGTYGFAGASGIGWRVEAWQKYAFFGEEFDWMRESGIWPVEHVMRLFSFSFVHPAPMSAVLAGVMLLALGKFVGEVFSAVATLMVFVVSAALGAIVFAVLTEANAPIMGAFPGVYGLIGAYTFMLWVGLGAMGEKRIQAFQLIGFLLGIQLLFGGGLDWIVDIAAFATGFLMSFLVSPGGFQRLRAKIRHK